MPASEPNSDLLNTHLCLLETFLAPPTPRPPTHTPAHTEQGIPQTGKQGREEREKLPERTGNRCNLTLRLRNCHPGRERQGPPA